MLHVGRRGPIFCQIIFYCDFWSTRKLLYFPLPVLLCLFICSSQTWHLNFSIFRGKNTRFYPWYFFLNLDPPSRPKCDSWACGMNDFFIDEYKRECFKLKLPFLTSREMHFEMDSTVDAISVMPADRTLDILCLETTRHALLHYTQLHYSTHSFSIFFASKLLGTRRPHPFAKLRPVKFISTQSFQRLNHPAF